MAAEKKEQLLTLDPPSELRFRGPFTKPVVTRLILKNPTNNAILFKIKTTAPKKYCVRPNFGAVQPYSQAQVEILLQACAFDPHERNRHKFMVQSFVVPEGATDYDQLWKEVQPKDLMDSKLRCIFEIPETPARESPAPNDSTVKSITAKSEDGEKQENDYMNDYLRASAEIRQLREEESLLRQENLKLKEALLRVKVTEANQKEQPTSSSSQYQNPYSPPQIGQQQIPVIYIAIAMCIFGFLFGKFLF